MANLPESSTWETGITQIEKGEILSGGSTGVANRALKQLVNRTKYIYDNYAINDDLLKYQIYSSNTTITSTQIPICVFANTNTSAWTLTLPASPSLGDRIIVVDVDENWDTNNLTIARNGSLINGLSEDLVCDSRCCQDSITLVYTNSTYGWKLFN